MDSFRLMQHNNHSPNRWGYDLFFWQLVNGEFIPAGATGTSYTDSSVYCSKTSTNNKNGIGCTFLAKSDPQYFKDLK